MSFSQEKIVDIIFHILIVTNILYILLNKVATKIICKYYTLYKKSEPSGFCDLAHFIINDYLYDL